MTAGFDPADIRALLFDFGGVIVRIDFDRVFRRWAELAGVPFGQVKSRFSHGEAYRAHERGEMDAKAYFASLRKELGIDLTDAQFDEGWQEVLLPEIEPTVRLLPRLARRLPCHLFSNTNLAHYEVWSRRYAPALAPLRQRFLSHELGVRKPEPESFMRVAGALDLAPGQILFFDDTVDNVVGARAAGLPAVHVRSPEDVAQAVRPWLD